MDANEARTHHMRRLVALAGGPAEWARRFGGLRWLQPQVSAWISEKNPKGIGKTLARALEEAQGLPRGSIDLPPDGPDTSVAIPEIRPGYVRFQVMGKGGAGPGVINSDYPEVLREVEIAEWQVRQELGRVPSPSRVKLLTVRGESMSPRIRSGDVVFVDIEDQSPYDGGLFVIVLHGHALVKRIEIRTDGLHIVSLAAPTRPDIVPPDRMDSLHIAGRVLGAIQLRKAEDLQ